MTALIYRNSTTKNASKELPIAIFAKESWNSNNNSARREGDTAWPAAAPFFCTQWVPAC